MYGLVHILEKLLVQLCGAFLLEITCKSRILSKITRKFR